jgi:hypothetical protein
MLELICYHKYIWGTIAADRSHWHSDGFSNGVTPNAATLHSDASLSFSTPQSRVVIPRRDGDPWGTMRALRVEIVAGSLEGVGGTIVDADGCFRISVDGLNTILVEILGYTLRVVLKPRPAFSSGDTVLWPSVTFSFWHDGVNQLGFTADKEILSPAVGPINVPGQVPPVGPQGVWIGNRIGSPSHHLIGNVSSVKIWRADPEAMVPPFLGRPFTPPLLKCWGDLIDRLRQAAAGDPECAAWWKNLIEQQQIQLVARLGQKSPDTLAELYQMCKAYQQLWSAGKVGSPEMRALMVKLRDWLKNEGIFSADDPALQRTLQNPCMAKFVGAAGDLNCDPDAQALIKAIIGTGSH